MAQLVGYKVEASDGSIGKIDKHTDYVGRQYIVVDTGPWIFGRHVMVPASLVTAVDEENQTVHLSATREQVKDSPEFEKGRHDDDVAFIQLIEKYYANRHM
ncbi:PRC-barrel domain containing protein [Streptomyces sp. NPDC046866]|uniref:PRC-barrel domain containing protein n=1 Tax=Streptomyces sp. NPDC046866 TaxID=3154921 RepID=UPI00345271C4